MKKIKHQPNTFEEALEKLEQIIERIEPGVPANNFSSGSKISSLKIPDTFFGKRTADTPKSWYSPANAPQQE